MMRPLRLQLIRRSDPLQHAGMVLLLLACALAILLGATYASRVATLEREQAKLTGLQVARKPSGQAVLASKVDVERTQSELKLADRVIARLSLQWEALFDEIEASVDEHITLLSVEPDAAKNLLKITAEAKNLGAMNEYIKRLGRSARFQDVYVQSHQIQLQDVGKPIHFVVSTRWLLAPEQPESALLQQGRSREDIRIAK